MSTLGSYSKCSAAGSRLKRCIDRLLAWACAMRAVQNVDLPEPAGPVTSTCARASELLGHGQSARSGAEGDALRSAFWQQKEAQEDRMNELARG